MNPQEGIEVPQNWETYVEPWIGSGLLFLKSLTTPWTLFQFGIIIVCYLVALVIANWTTGPLEASIRNIRNQPRLLRLLALLLRRLHWIYFALILWGVSIVMKQVTWPSRSYFVSIAAGLVTAWVVIRIALQSWHGLLLGFTL
jgi:hypothetical protein